MNNKLLFCVMFWAVSSVMFAQSSVMPAYRPWVAERDLINVSGQELLVECRMRRKMGMGKGFVFAEITTSEVTTTQAGLTTASTEVVSSEIQLLDTTYIQGIAISKSDSDEWFAILATGEGLMKVELREGRFATNPPSMGRVSRCESATIEGCPDRFDITPEMLNMSNVTGIPIDSSLVPTIVDMSNPVVIQRNGETYVIVEGRSNQRGGGDRVIVICEMNALFSGGGVRQICVGEQPQVIERQGNMVVSAKSMQGRDSEVKFYVSSDTELWREEQSMRYVGNAIVDYRVVVQMGQVFLAEVSGSVGEVPVALSRLDVRNAVWDRLTNPSTARNAHNIGDGRRMIWMRETVSAVPEITCLNRERGLSRW